VDDVLLTLIQAGLLVLAAIGLVSFYELLFAAFTKWSQR
jgi:hypothetical protein